MTAQGEPTFSIYGEGISAALEALGDRVDEAVEACEALVFASNTLVGPERAVTLRARERALELGRPVVLRPEPAPGALAERARPRSRRPAAAWRAACW